MSDENNEQIAETEATEENAFVPKKSFKNKVLDFIKKYPKHLIIGGILLVVVIFAWMIIYFSFFYQNTIDKLADQFCDCANESKSDYYNYSKDGFGYRSDLSSCFAEDFILYGEQFNKKEKKKLLEEFQAQVLKKCPNKLNDIFEYK